MASKESRSTITHFNQPIYIPNKLLKFEDIRLDEQKSRSPDEVATPTLVKQNVFPYRQLYLTFCFDSRYDIFLRNQPIIVEIINVDSSSSNILNPYLYSVKVKHGAFQWTVYRRYKHFQNLHRQLTLLQATLNIPFPTKSHREQRASFKTVRSSAPYVAPRFPLKPEALISLEEVEQRKKQLENYLRAILDHQTLRLHNETLSFLEVSLISFIDQLGPKRKEGLVKKQRIDYPLYGCFTGLFSAQSCGVWRRRWLFVKDSYVGYLRKDLGEVRCILLMDQDFKVVLGNVHKGSTSGLIISNLSRQIVVKDWTKRKALEWVDCIEKAANSTGKDFTSPNRFGSFAPLRMDSPCTWFVDGCNYMSSVADAIDQAQEEILIADWWLSPEIYMKRPVTDGNKWRLDALLHRKAEEGVRIFILIYKEVEMALGINSLYTKRQLASKHPNIKVLRHPDHVASGVIFWAHHEKLVCVDQTIAFLGGIDLCYGRWDNEYHRLTDLGSTEVQNQSAGVMKMVQSSHTVGQHIPSTLLYLAKAANKVTIGTVTNIPAQTKSDQDSGRIVTAVGKMRARGMQWADELKDKGRQFTGVKGGLGAKNRYDSEISLNVLNSSSRSVETTIDETESPFSTINEDCNGNAESGLHQLWIGKDYTNFIVKDFSQLDQPLKDAFDRSSTPRMPWHDVAVSVTGHAARDAARHFIQRWNAVKVEKVKDDPTYPFLLPKSYHLRYGPLRYFHGSMSTRTNCQILRSTTTWSTGMRVTETSIQEAYIHAIKNAKHYIYIENQFFITLAGGSGDEISNRIGRSLYERIVEAHRAGTTFRVYVVMPLLPGFEGEIGTGSGTAIQAILHWNYASICRGTNSLMQKLRDVHIEPLTYVSFYGLRNNGELNEQPITELIYVHSKLMIVDDNLVICGSANINDRSLSGKRDSEIALVIQDDDFVRSTMKGQPYQAGRFALSLRKRLFREHLGILHTESDIDISDPIADSFYKGTWMHIAALNTKIYDKVFRCLPADSITSFAQLSEIKSHLALAITDPSVAQEHLTEIQGNLVLLPLLFLSQENLTPGAGTAESLMPTSLWT